MEFYLKENKIVFEKLSDEFIILGDSDFGTIFEKDLRIISFFSGLKSQFMLYYVL